MGFKIKKQKEKESTKDWCSKDRYHRHCWSSIGVIEIDRRFIQIYKCSQCKRIVTEKLNEIIGAKKLKVKEETVYCNHCGCIIYCRDCARKVKARKIVLEE